ncbi:MAG TPA: cupin-like domain-containing protein [Kofleriaceae bacterium]|nr:cupin-like domain-containing protein [Kofleriaceae bacterium]
MIDFGDTFDQLRITRLRHHLADHPLMTTTALAALALRIDPDYVRFHDGERSLGTDMETMLRTDPDRRCLRKAIDNLHKEKAFVQIINVRSDPQYARLLDEFFDEVYAMLPVRDRRLVNRDAAAFLASPRSVTPFHLDHEQNFLCHIRGPKTFYVWDPRDRVVVSERALESFYRDGTLRGAEYRPEMQARAQAFELSPGDAIFMPMGSPHAAATGDDITVTFSVLLNTLTSYDIVETYRVNHVLRRIGLSPRPVGDSWMRDSLKYRTLGAVRRVRALARGRKEQPRLQWY